HPNCCIISHEPTANHLSASLLHSSSHAPTLHSFPTRRSSDLSKATATDAVARGHDVTCVTRGQSGDVPPGARRYVAALPARHARDRKSTRLNSSHSQISYAVFCLKKKKNQDTTPPLQAAMDRRRDRREALAAARSIAHALAVLTACTGCRRRPCACPAS